MAKQKKYPSVKYRVVNGNGNGIYYSLEQVKEVIANYAKNTNQRFHVQYVVKITEELLDISNMSNNKDEL